MSVGSDPQSTRGEGDGLAGSGDQSEALRALAAAVADRDLGVPAMLLLEMARPLHLLIQQAFYVTHPLLRPWLGDRLLLWADLLEDTEALDHTLRSLAVARRSDASR